MSLSTAAIGAPRPSAKPKTKLRPYQAEAIESLFRLWEESPKARPLLVLPTGAGKSVINAEVARRFTQDENLRVIAVTHVKELVEQNYTAFLRVWSGPTPGIYCASLNRKDRMAQVTFASVQSIVNAADQFTRVGLLMIDEAHLIPHDGDGQYQTLIKALQKNNPDLVIAGMTATPWRLNSGNLCEPWKGVQPIFTEVAYELPLLDLVLDGYLAPLVSKSTKTKLDTSGVSKRGGEFIESQLDKAVNVEALNKSIVTETIAACGERKSWLVFAVSIDHARRLRDLFIAGGIKAEFVSGETSTFERDRLIRAFKAGKLRCLVNCAVLTTGFDAPGTDAIIFARPTQSPGLFLQIAGRGIRPVYADGYDLDTTEGRLAAIKTGPKPNCLMLDFAGNTLRHGLIDQVKGVFKSKADPDESDNLKECQVCSTYVVRGTMTCPECGTAFPKGGGSTAAEREQRLFASNTAGKVATDVGEVFWASVVKATCQRHQKYGKPDSVRISYLVNDTTSGQQLWTSEWLCFSHGDDNWATKKARMEWRTRAKTRAPMSTDEALARMTEMVVPRQVRLRRDERGFVSVLSVRI